MIEMMHILPIDSSTFNQMDIDGFDPPCQRVHCLNLIDPYNDIYIISSDEIVIIQ